MKKNRTLRPEDEAKYGLYGKLALISNPVSEPLLPMKKFKQAISNNYNLNNNIITGDQNLNNLSNNVNNISSNTNVNSNNNNHNNNNNNNSNVNNNNFNNVPKANEIDLQVNIYVITLNC